MDSGKTEQREGGNFVAADLVCMKCGYLLRTLRREEKCPECGTAVAESEDRKNKVLVPSIPAERLNLIWGGLFLTSWGPLFFVGGFVVCVLIYPLNQTRGQEQLLYFLAYGISFLMFSAGPFVFSIGVGDYRGTMVSAVLKGAAIVFGLLILSDLAVQAISEPVLDRWMGLDQDRSHFLLLIGELVIAHLVVLMGLFQLKLIWGTRSDENNYYDYVPWFFVFCMFMYLLANCGFWPITLTVVFIISLMPLVLMWTGMRCCYLAFREYNREMGKGKKVSVEEKKIG